MRVIAFVFLALIGTPAFGQTDMDVYTLYRNSVLDPAMRLHIATFDSADGKVVNDLNCATAADLFQRQPGVQTRFWCEPGRVRK